MVFFLSLWSLSAPILIHFIHYFDQIWTKYFFFFKSAFVFQKENRFKRHDYYISNNSYNSFEILNCAYKIYTTI